MLHSKEKAALATNITRLVKASPLSRKVSATHAKVADGAIGNMMYGKGNPTLDSMAKLAAFFRTSTAALLTEQVPRQQFAQESLALYHSDASLNQLLTAFQQLTTADQQEFLHLIEARAAKNKEIVKELSERNSPAAAAFRPAVSDSDVERRMRLPASPR